MGQTLSQEAAEVLVSRMIASYRDTTSGNLKKSVTKAEICIISGFILYLEGKCSQRQKSS